MSGPQRQWRNHAEAHKARVEARKARGVVNGPRLDERRAARIRHALAAGARPCDLAEAYNVTAGWIGCIGRLQAWKATR